MKVWISKYALTQGIEEIEAKICNNEDMVERVKDTSIVGFQPSQYYHGEGREWHLTKEEAIKKAEEMRDKKIRSVQKQLEKLQNMKFE